MHSTELQKVIADADQAWHGPDGTPMMNPNEPTKVATYRATLEVAFQLALLNERIDAWEGWQSPLRVMVEPGEWPISVKEHK